MGGAATGGYNKPAAPYTYPEPAAPATYAEPAAAVAEPAEYDYGAPPLVAQQPPESQPQYQVPYSPLPQGPPQQVPSYAPSTVQGYAPTYSQPLSSSSSSQPSYNHFLGPPTHSLPYYG